MAREARAQLEAATVERPEGSTLRPARLAVAVPEGRTPEDLGAQICQALEPLTCRFERLSAGRTDVALIILPNRVFRGDPASAFSAAYAVADAFALDLVEPDLPVDVVPVPDASRAGPAHESVDNFPPGCWVARDAALDSTKHWAVEAIRAPEAWKIAEQAGRPVGGAGIIVAQPDTGVAHHPELEGINRAGGFNLLELDKPDDPTDPLNYFGNPGHGTGTASALASPPAGEIVGAAPQLRHMPIRAIESVVRVSQVTVAQAIDLAVDKGAHVITISLGGLPSFSLHKAVQRAVAANVVVLAAAGNCVREVVFPARYSICIAIGGIDKESKIWPGSCRGPEVAVSAPAENVFVAKFLASSGEAAVDQGQGTSYAVALSAGVAALWLAHHGRDNLIAAARARGETLQVMFRRLARASAQRPPGWDSAHLGAGVIDAGRLLGADLDAGRGLESVAQLPVRDDAAGQIRRMAAGLAQDARVAMSDVRWELLGPELILALVNRQKGRAPGTRLETVQPIDKADISAKLSATAARSPALTAALAA